LKRICFFLFLLLTFISGNTQSVVSDSWETVKAKKQGAVTMYWYESQPFIFRNAGGMAGIEYEIIEDFRKFLKDNYGVKLRVVWKEGRSFGDTYKLVREAQNAGIFGVSAFSVTPERQRDVSFSKSYMSDISVLITSKGIPIVQSREGI
jgi:hypothetical protein